MKEITQELNIMEARFFYGAATHRTWPKLFVLTEDGILYTQFLDFMSPKSMENTFDFKTFEATDYSWSDYQSLVEIDEETAKSKNLTKQSNWIESYLNKK